MNARQFRYILVLAAEGSFSKAAKVLNISQPSLSQYVKKIEKQCGLSLFERTNNEVRLTDAGRVYIEAGRKILDIEHQMEGQFLSEPAAASGQRARRFFHDFSLTIRWDKKRGLMIATSPHCVLV